MHPLPAPRFPLFDLVCLGERRKQPLSLGDLGHFRRRRKALERGSEDGVGVSGAAGRLAELGEPKRRAQFEAARPLLTRDGDGGLEGFFCQRRLGGIAFGQQFAADAMQFGLESAMACAVGGYQRFVEDGECAVDIAGAGFRLGKSNLDEPVEDQDVLLTQQFDATTHRLEPGVERVASVNFRQALVKNPPHSKERQIMLMREPGEFDGVWRGAREIAPHVFAHSHIALPSAREAT
jgi:hypothetical protein